ncbi:hypothetical protein, partial [Jatrophihabitans lederbergiae]
MTTYRPAQPPPNGSVSAGSADSADSADQRSLRRNSMSTGHIVFFVVAAAAPLTVVGSLFS